MNPFLPLLAEDGSISNDLFKYIAGALALAVVGLCGYIVKLQATARSDMMANLPVLTLCREMLESVKTTMTAMTVEIAELKSAVERCSKP